MEVKKMTTTSESKKARTSKTEIEEPTVIEQTKNQSEKAAASSENEEAVLIYCGPANIYISRYASFTNGLPDHLKEHLEKCPILKALFVDSDGFAEFEQNVQQPGSVESVWFEEANKYFKAVKG